MHEWDNRVQMSPRFVGYIQDMLDGCENNPEAIRVYQDDTGPWNGKAGEISFVWSVEENEDTE
ncbi:hypothetical protein [Halorubrum spindle-shaped virus-BLv25]|nr:hypothetical protein [Halorubrum spindle-shaped virus-BLv25]